MEYIPRLPDEEVNVTAQSPLRNFFVLLLGLAAIVVGVYLVLGLAVELILPRISPEFEHKLAGYFLHHFESKRSLSEKESSLQHLMDGLQSKCTDLPYHFKVHLSPNTVVNAVSLPGGHVVIFSALLDTIHSENELTFVLAHEIGHYANRDHLKGFGRGLLLVAISSLLFGPDNALSNFMVQLIQITEMQFSQKAEEAADRYALDALHCYYGHVGGSTDFFQTLKKEEKWSFSSHFTSTHPKTQKRIQNLNAYASHKKYTNGPLCPLPEELKQDSIVNPAGTSLEDYP